MLPLPLSPNSPFLTQQSSEWSIKMNLSWAWWLAPVILALMKLKQDYLSWRSGWAAELDPVSNKQKSNNTLPTKKVTLDQNLATDPYFQSPELGTQSLDSCILSILIPSLAPPCWLLAAYCFPITATFRHALPWGLYSHCPLHLGYFPQVLAQF